MSPNEAIAEQLIFDPTDLKDLEIEKLKSIENDKKDYEKAIKDYEEMINRPFYKRTDIKWKNMYFTVVLHLIALYGFLTFPYLEKKLTFFFIFFMAALANFGVAGGAHRLWAHRAYKAKLPLRIILLLCYAASGQYSIKWWSRDHRVHHKFSETNADPVNSKRGFWFSHVGWLTMPRHPEVLRKGGQVDISDILADPVIQFGEKYYHILKPICCFIVPTLIPVYFWNETWYWAIMSQVFMRYAYSLNCTWGVNSFAHMFGGHPYDKNIAPSENFMMTLMTGGEGWHNYHHTFPWDYKTSELGNYSLSINTNLITFFSKIGWAYDLKEPSKELVRNVIKNRGDGTHPVSEVPEPKSE